jgi:hypothetical protein
MATFNIRAFDASRNQLDDRIDVHLQKLPSMQLVKSWRNQSGKKTITVTGLDAGQIYGVQVFPLRHRPVGVVRMAPSGTAPDNVHVFCPVNPRRVVKVTFPDWVDLAPELQAVLEQPPERPEPDAGPDPAFGRDLYDSLADVPKAGLLNLFTKMQNTVTGGRTMWSFVRDVYRIRGDRIFANVAVDFRDHVKSAVTDGSFAEVDGSLHTPPPGFASADSFKHQLYQAGVLQLTFFSSVDQPLRFKVDADIDDADGLGHVFQVLRNWLTQGETSPYDIREILAFSQLLEPGYSLNT